MYLDHLLSRVYNGIDYRDMVHLRALSLKEISHIQQSLYHSGGQKICVNMEISMKRKMENFWMGCEHGDFGGTYI